MIGLHLLNAVGGGVLHRNQPTGSAGKWSDNFVPFSTFPVRRPYAPGAAELLMAQRLETKVTHITYTQPGIDIQRGDRLVVEGIEYNVTAILPPSKAHHLKVMLEKREYGTTVA